MARPIRLSGLTALFTAIAAVAVAQQATAPRPAPPPLPASTTEAFFKTADGVKIHYLLTAGFGGSGLTETDPKYRAEAEALDAAMPKATGEDAAAMERFRSRVAQSGPAGSTPVSQERGPAVDLEQLNIPILAVNGSFDNPHAKTHRLWREAKIFENVVLPEKTHLTAIGAGGAPPSQQYIDVISRFIEAYDAK